MTRIGVLALQGGFARHLAAFADVGVAASAVRHVEALENFDGLVIPGGESTTLLNLMDDEPWFDRLREFHGRGGALWGTCAGAILLAREVLDPRQPSLGLLDATIRRNAFGRQIDSFETRLEASDGGTLSGVFIRAPRFVELGPDVEVLARYEDEPVLVRQGRILAATFHPELTEDRRLQHLFVEMTGKTQQRHATTVAGVSSQPARVSGEQERRVRC
jgi:5'-phosphate synthase pdxT subunit